MVAIFSTMNGIQAGDPAKLAKGLIKVVNSKDAPVRLLISKGAIPTVDACYKARYTEFEKWQRDSTLKKPVSIVLLRIPNSKNNKILSL